MKDDFLAAVAGFADRYGMLPAGCRVLAAVSGGVDSMCLLTVLTVLAKERGFTLYAAHFDHELRGAESRRDAEFVSAYCEKAHIPCLVGGGDVAGAAAERKAGVEETARELRYAFLESAADRFGADRIATAHTADDNAETVLMNLTRGAGLSGLAGIPPLRGRIVRPMLRTTRSMVEHYAAENGIPHVEDSTNENNLYTRNRIRHLVVPVLKEINPEFSGTVSRFSALAAEDNACLEELADRFLRDTAEGNRLPAAALAALPRPVSSRAVRSMCGRPLPQEAVESVLALCSSNDPSAEADLPGLRVRREYNSLVFGADEPGSFAPFSLAPGETVVCGELGLRFSCKKMPLNETIYKSFNIFVFKFQEICGNITVRPRSPGDAIRLAGRNGTKSLKKLFIEKKIPASRRGLVPVVADEEGPVAVYGFGADLRVAAQPGDDVLKLVIEEIPEHDGK